MASASYSEDLMCSICLNIFTDPVNVPCGHSFCRSCISEVLSRQQQCPQCRVAVASDAQSLPSSLILKTLAEKAQQAEKRRQQGGSAAELCPEHEEKLKLFCVTDQQLACIICRDGEKHEGHRFKPIKEAAAALRKDLEMFMQQDTDDISSLESLANKQSEEMLKTKEKSQQLMAMISSQFQEMYQFLRRREDEIKKELKHQEEEGIGTMRETLNSMEAALSGSRELQEKVTSVCQITECEEFLRSWTAGKRTLTSDLFRPRAAEFQVVEGLLSLGPYESHLQFFIWKEMLQTIQPREEKLTLKNNSPETTVSDDGRSLFSAQKKNQAQGFMHPSFGSSQSFAHSSTFAFGNQSPRMYSNTSFTPAVVKTKTRSKNEFTSGQHYWEIETRTRNYWELGIINNFLKFDGKKYSANGPNMSTELTFSARPRKIGVYLNCSSMKLSFYNADDMTHIHTMTTAFTSTPLPAELYIQYREPDYDPLTVCWY